MPVSYNESRNSAHPEAKIASCHNHYHTCFIQTSIHNHEKPQENISPLLRPCRRLLPRRAVDNCMQIPRCSWVACIRGDVQHIHCKNGVRRCHIEKELVAIVVVFCSWCSRSQCLLQRRVQFVSFCSCWCCTLPEDR